jgi:hypothetical protein
MAKPVRPGTGTTHMASKALQPDKQNGTRFADSIRASSLLTDCTNRPDRRLHPTNAPDHQIALATPEPSTEDATRA